MGTAKKDEIKEELENELEFFNGEDPIVESDTIIRDYTIEGKPNLEADLEDSKIIKDVIDESENLPKKRGRKAKEKIHTFTPIKNSFKEKEIIEEPKQEEQPSNDFEKSTNQNDNQYQTPPSMSFDEAFGIDDDDEFEEENHNDNAHKSSSNQIATTSEMSDDATDYTADFFLNLASTQIPIIVHNLSKIDEKIVENAENKRLLPRGTTKKIAENNKKNSEKLKLSKTEIDMISVPLKQVLKKRDISTTPETMLVIALVVVSVGMYMNFREIKQGNDKLMAILREEIDKNNSKGFHATDENGNKVDIVEE